MDQLGNINWAIWFKHILLINTKGSGVAKLQRKPSPSGQIGQFGHQEKKCNLRLLGKMNEVKVYLWWEVNKQCGKKSVHILRYWSKTKSMRSCLLSSYMDFHGTKSHGYYIDIRIKNPRKGNHNEWSMKHCAHTCILLLAHKENWSWSASSIHEYLQCSCAYICSKKHPQKNYEWLIDYSDEYL